MFGTIVGDVIGSVHGWRRTKTKNFPDFVARSTDGSRWIIETKGREDIAVRLKDQAAERWCENATLLIGTQWSYLKVGQKEFEALHPDSLMVLVEAISSIPSLGI